MMNVWHKRANAIHKKAYDNFVILINCNFPETKSSPFWNKNWKITDELCQPSHKCFQLLSLFLSGQIVVDKRRNNQNKANENWVPKKK